MRFDKTDVENYMKFGAVLKDKGVSFTCDGAEAQIKVSALIQWYYSIGEKLKAAAKEKPAEAVHAKPLNKGIAKPLVKANKTKKKVSK